MVPRNTAAFFGFLALLVPGCAHAALDPQKPMTQYTLRVLQGERGLPEGAVEAMVQTRDGYIWLGTEEGLARFDGVRFFTFDKSNTPELKENGVSALAVDGEDNLWIGTRGGGLVRFRKGVFESYGARLGPQGDSILALYADTQGTIWVGTEGHGLLSVAGRKTSHYGAAEGLLANTILAIAGDAAGHLWLGTQKGAVEYSGGLFRPVQFSSNPRKTDAASSAPGKEQQASFSDSGRASASFADASNPRKTDASASFAYSSNPRKTDASASFALLKQLSAKEVRAICAGASGSVWLAVGGTGVVQLKDGVSHLFTKADGLSDDVISALAEDERGTLWIGSFTSGLGRLAEGRMSSLTDRNGFPTGVHTILLDRSGGIWTGGHSIVHLYEGAVTPIGRPEGLRSEVALSVFGDARGAVWMGTDGGLDRWTGSVSLTVDPSKLPGKEVFSLAQDGAGDIWAGTRHGLSRIHDGKVQAFSVKDGLFGDAVIMLFTDRRGRLWAGSRAGLSWFDGKRFHGYTIRDGLPDSAVGAMFEDAKGTFWIGTWGAGLVELKDGHFSNWSPSEKSSENFVLSLAGEPDGTVWLGTMGGLLRRKDGRFIRYRSESGLLSEEISAILDDLAGNLWLTSNKGIFRVSKKDLNDPLSAGGGAVVRCKIFGTSDGMRSHECNGGFQPAGWRTSDGRLWFPTMKGVAVIEPSAATRTKTPFPATIEKLASGNRVVAAGSGVRIQPGRRELAAEFTTPEFENQDSLRFRYLLEGFDREWVQAGTRREAYYTNLPPGEYRFRVQAYRDDVYGPEASSGVITVEPALFERKVTWVLIALLLAGTGFGVHRVRVGRLRARERRLVGLVEQRTQELRESRDQLEIRVQERTEDLRLLNEALQAEVSVRREAENKAEAASRAKSEFLTNMSHELRTPINGIMGMADLAMMTELDAEQTEYIGIIRQSSDALLHIVTDILDFSSMEAQEFRLEEKLFDLRRELDQVRRGPEEQAIQKGLAFRFEVGEEVPRHLIGDAGGLRNVLENLLENALKFTPSGCIFMGVWREGGDERRVTLRFVVRDTGVGIPEEKQKSIFDAFSQADNSSTRRYGGTGLGLTICSQLVRLMHGRLWVASEPGSGSTFQFTAEFGMEAGRDIGFIADSSEERSLAPHLRA